MRSYVRCTSIAIAIKFFQVYVKVHMKAIRVRGNCTLSSMFFSTSGPFNLTARNVTAEGRVNLVVSSDGTVRANNSATEITYEQLNVSTIPNSV